MAQEMQREIGAFVRLWLVLEVSFLLLLLALNLALYNRIDLRAEPFYQAMLIPFGQALVCRVIARGSSNAD